MSALRDAAQMALEALEEIHVGNMTPMAEESWNKAITALRAALADHIGDADKKEGDNLAPPLPNCNGMPVVEGPLSEAQTITFSKVETISPVAWMHERDGVATLNTTPPEFYGDHWEHRPLYTSPPKRKPLTDEEIKAIYDGLPREYTLAMFARAIERAHGIGDCS